MSFGRGCEEEPSAAQQPNQQESSRPVDRRLGFVASTKLEWAYVAQFRGAYGITRLYLVL